MRGTRLKQTIALTYAYYNQGKTLPDAVLQMYCEDLSDQDEGKCVDAYMRWRRNPANKFFPLPANILEMVNPEMFVAPETKARETAARIVGAVTKFGWVQGKAAKDFIGEEGWAVVSDMGGWSYLCENLGVALDVGTTQAQMRDRLMGIFKHGRNAIAQSIGVEQPKWLTREKQPAIKVPDHIADVIQLPPRPEGA